MPLGLLLAAPSWRPEPDPPRAALAFAAMPGPPRTPPTALLVAILACFKIRRMRLVAAFARVGWGWGGNWSWPKDYQHFSANGT